MNDLVYLVFIRPPKKVSDWILKTNREVSKRFDNSYMSNANYDWESHLMVYLGRVSKSNENQVVSAAEEVAHKFTSFDVALTGIELGEKGYIFLGVGKKSYPPLVAMHQELISRLKEIEIEGYKYKYTPHLTIAKVQENQVQDVVDFVGNPPFVSEVFTADKLMVARETENTNWPVIAEFPLREVK